MLRYLGEEFKNVCNRDRTVGIDFKIKDIYLLGLRIELQLWDTAGNEIFRDKTKSYFRGPRHGILFLYDVTDRASFQSIVNWIHTAIDEEVSLNSTLYSPCCYLYLITIPRISIMFMTFFCF